MTAVCNLAGERRIGRDKEGLRLAENRDINTVVSRTAPGARAHEYQTPPQSKKTYIYMCLQFASAPFGERVEGVLHPGLVVPLEKHHGERTRTRTRTRWRIPRTQHPLQAVVDCRLTDTPPRTERRREIIEEQQPRGSGPGGA